MYNILICDDEQDIVNALKIYLSGGDYCLFEASNGREALEVVEKNDIHLILMDVMMPLMDGLEATRTIRAMQRPDAATIPIVAMTANTFSEDEQRSREAGMNLFLNKPVDSGKMLQTVLECLKMGGEMLCENLDKNAGGV